MRTVFLLVCCFISSVSLHAGAGYYTVTFPNDTTVYGCGASVPYTPPIINPYGPCNFGVGVSYHDEVFYLNGAQSCYKVARRWRLQWWCDYHPSYTPTVIPNPLNTDQGPTVDANAINHGFLEYTQIIKVLDGQAPVIDDCPANALDICDITDNDPALWNASYWWNTLTGSHNLCEVPVDLGVHAFDSCSGNNLQARYLLFLDTDNNGSMETVVSSTNPPQPGTVAVGNAENPNFSGGVVRTFDHRSVPVDQKYQFTAETSVDSTTGTYFAALRWNTVEMPDVYLKPQLPAGKHKIKWFFEDGCGNTASCEYNFTIKDCKAPTVVCLNGLSINLMATGMAMLTDTAFVHYFNDNCTPNDKIQLGIRKAGAGTGFPQNSHVVNFDCTELGKQEVEIWALDADGNADFCKTFVDVQDHIGICGPSSKFAAQTLSISGKALKGVPVFLQQGSNAVAMAISDDTGAAWFDPQASGCQYALTPVFDTLTAQGINTLDALMTALHVAGLSSLNDPYALLAADADGDGVVDATDIKAIVQVLLGQTAHFPGQTAWQFVPAGYVFTDPVNPFAPAAPGFVDFCLTPGASPMHAFLGVKTGDVNKSANMSFKGETADARKGSVTFRVKKQRFAAGQHIRVPVRIAEMTDIAGLQLSLGYNPEALTLQSVNPGLIPADWLQINSAAKSVGASWHSLEAFSGNGFKAGSADLFVLTFTALKDGLLEDNLFLSYDNLLPEAYDINLQTLSGELVFERAIVKKETFSIGSPAPNPAAERVTVDCFMPVAGEVQFRWMDSKGVVCSQQQLSLPAGEQQVTLTTPKGINGLLYLQANSSAGSAAAPVVKE